MQWSHLGWVLGRDPKLRSPVREGVLHPTLCAHGHALLDAGRAGDPLLALEVLPGDVEPLGPDEREHISLAAILPDQGCRESEPSSGLQLGGRAEHRSW
jgi:hypothetical protein